ncbi:MAG: IucA/IucC family siderophore biosynthesis protein [Cyanobacteria bacterium QS_6_48_18]|nr:MAG: IucA/IucC family siderophore biosynthesis protein [Cyanobacteria bacterium QS_6_48_18]
MFNKNIRSKQMSQKKAEEKTIQNLLNCYFREIDQGEWLATNIRADDQVGPQHDFSTKEGCIRCYLPSHSCYLIANLRYWSLIGIHLYYFPILTQYSEEADITVPSNVGIIELIVSELVYISRDCSKKNYLLNRVIQSCKNIQEFLKTKNETLNSGTFLGKFIQAEQSLLYGHQMHPTPKSRQGFTADDLSAYSPELKSRFQLSYFRIHNSIVQEASSLDSKATDLIKDEVLLDPEVDENFKNLYCHQDEYSLIPVHPWQADYLLRQESIKRLIYMGWLEFLNCRGRFYFPTSSIRTLYHPKSNFMFKMSMSIKITNSLRVLMKKELYRGIDVHRLSMSNIGKNLYANFPKFLIIRDPAYISLRDDNSQECPISVILRENWFKSTCCSADVISIVALCQESAEASDSKLAKLIRYISRHQESSLFQVSLNWFQSYLGISLEPLLWLYSHYGIALSAHQQNSILELKSFYPHRFFFRDTQDFYYCYDYYDLLDSIIPGMGIGTENMYDTDVIEEIFIYNLFVNNLFGIVNVFATSKLIDEKLLLEYIKNVLVNYNKKYKNLSKLFEKLLSAAKLPCKGNLLTSLYDMDEVAASNPGRPYFVYIDNPLLSV